MPNSQPRRPLLAAFGVFVLAASAAAALIWHSERHDRREESAHAVSLAGEYAQNLQRSIEHSLSATYALAALVRQGKGAVPEFEEIAEQMLPMYPGVAEFALVPGGVIRQVAPLAGNEKALGLDLLQDPVQKREALLARNSGKLTLAGPLELVQGGVGVVGRLPVFFDENTEKPRFWGFTLVVIRLPEALEVINLSRLTGQGFAYELWREHPDTRQKQVIAASSGTAPRDPVQRTLQVPNGAWNLSIAPLAGWGDPLALGLKSALGVLVSLLFAYVAMLLLILRKHKQGLEAVVAKRTDALREGEIRYRALFDANPQPMWVYDMDSLAFLAVNDAAVAHYGYHRWEFLAMRITDIRTPEEAARLMQRVEVVRKDDVRDAGVWQHRRKDGSLIDVEVTAHTLDFGGRRAQIVHVSDVTERLRAERALREGEARFRAIAELSSDWYWEQDEHLRFVRPATPMEGQQDVSLDSFYGKTRREAPGVVYDAPQLAELEAICEARQPFRDFEIGRRSEGGPKRYVQLSGEPIFEASGRFAGYRGVGKDITQRKRAEAHLLLAASVFDHSQEGIMITDAGANIVSVNKRFTKSPAIAKQT
jgi:PAS domain S-box-containing protein